MVNVEIRWNRYINCKTIMYMINSHHKCSDLVSLAIFLKNRDILRGLGGCDGSVILSRSANGFRIVQVFLVSGSCKVGRSHTFFGGAHTYLAEVQPRIALGFTGSIVARLKQGLYSVCVVH